MPSYTLSELLQNLPGGNHAVCSFNVYNLEFTEGVIRAAEQEEAPVILMISELALEITSLEMLLAICQTAARRSRAPVALLLDHGKTPRVIEECIHSGISVMFDGSALPLEENIRKTADFTRQAHRHHVSIEAELGSLDGAEDGGGSRSQRYTDPVEAGRFVRETGVDALAVSIGNRHGYYRGKSELDFSRLHAIRERVDVPLVLHGGSDLPDERVRRAVAGGIRKLNIGTDLKCAYARRLKEVLGGDPLPIQPGEILPAAREAVTEEALGKIRLASGSGLAGRFGAACRERREEKH